MMADNQRADHSGRATARLQKELLEMMNNPPDGITAFPSEDNLMTWNAVIVGPGGSPYEGLEYRLLINFSDQYPFQAPKVQFLTVCYHPNVLLKSPGDICLDILQNNWSAVMSTSSVLVSIQSLLEEPNPDSPLNAEAAQLWGTNRNLYKEKVIEYHRRH